MNIADIIRFYRQTDNPLTNLNTEQLDAIKTCANNGDIDNFNFLHKTIIDAFLRTSVDESSFEVIQMANQYLSNIAYFADHGNELQRFGVGPIQAYTIDEHHGPVMNMFRSVVGDDYIDNKLFVKTEFYKIEEI